MPALERYTPEQREAMAIAAVDYGHSSRRVVDLAAAGELVDGAGQVVQAFAIGSDSTVRTEVGKLRRRREKKRATQAASASLEHTHGVSDSIDGPESAGTLLAAHRAVPRAEAPIPRADMAERSRREQEEGNQAAREEAERAEEEPGAWARQQITELHEQHDEAARTAYSSGPPTSGGQMLSRPEAELDYSRLPPEDTSAITGAEEGSRRTRMRGWAPD